MKIALSVAFLFAAACGDGVHSDPEEVITHHGADGGSMGGSDGTDAPPTLGGIAAQKCAQPEGPLHPYTQQAQVEQLIVGRWLHCSGPSLLEDEQAGIEFVADGTYFGLAFDGSKLVRTTGFEKQGTWDAYQETEISVQLNWHPTPASGNGGAPLFEDNPRRFAIDLGGSPSIYVIAD